MIFPSDQTFGQLLISSDDLRYHQGEERSGNERLIHFLSAQHWWAISVTTHNDLLANTVIDLSDKSLEYEDTHQHTSQGHSTKSDDWNRGDHLNVPLKRIACRSGVDNVACTGTLLVQTEISDVFGSKPSNSDRFTTSRSPFDSQFAFLDSPYRDENR